MNVLPLQHEDLPRMRELQPPDWSDIFPVLEFYLQKPFCHPLKVVEGDKIIGLGTTYIHEDTVWLAHVIAHPGERNRGVGRVITQALVDSVKNEYETIYLIATDLGAPVYNKIGFITEGEYAFMVREEAAAANEDTSSNIFPYSEKYKEPIYWLDKEITGENRQQSIEAHLQDARLYIENDSLQGVYFPSWGDGSIIAQAPSAGIALMQERIKIHSKASMPVENTEAMNFLLANGFKEMKRAKRMRFGKQRAWHPENIYNRVAGKLG